MSLRKEKPFTVTARFGTVSGPVLRTVIARSEVWPSFCFAGKVAVGTSTWKLP